MKKTKHTEEKIIAAVTTLAPGSIKRELATLRRLLRLAYEWKLINRVPRIRLLRGEKNREFTLPQDGEVVYLAALSTPLCKVAMMLLDTGLRLGELLSLDWAPSSPRSGKRRHVRLSHDPIRRGEAHQDAQRATEQPRR
jgi:integrase